MAEERKLPLQGLKVVELGTHFAVPSVTRMLADWGAEVIKVENVKGDAWRIVGRNQKCPITDEENPFFMVPNANKKVCSIKLKGSRWKRSTDQADRFSRDLCHQYAYGRTDQTGI